MSQPTLPEPSDNHRPETESTSFVKRGRLWIPETAQRRSPLQKFWHWTGFKEKKLWDVLQLLIVPTVLAIGAFYLQETAKQRDLQIAESNRQKDQQIADDRVKQETLNRYFDQISTLLFEQKLRTAKEGDEARTVARVRTLSALQVLDGTRRSQLVDFLQEAQLIQGRKPIISLRRANLKQLDFDFARLSKTDLRNADLREAKLFGAEFNGTGLSGADLSKARLVGAKFRNALLVLTQLEGADLYGADFTEAVLAGAFLQGTNLAHADFTGAVLKGANLRGATFDKTKLRIMD